MASDRERQAAELSLLETMYLDDFRWQTQPDPATPEVDPKVNIKISGKQDERDTFLSHVDLLMQFLMLLPTNMLRKILYPMQD